MMRRLYHRAALRSILGLALSAAAAPALAGPREDAQLWLQVNTNLPLGDGFRLTLEQIGRAGERAGGLTQTEFGALLGYKLSDRVELAFGYRKVGMHNTAAADEDRLRQQVVASFGPVVTRLRIDERFHPGGDQIGFRLRPLVRYNHAVGGGFALFASHESFFFPNSTRWGQRAGYDRMRNVAGVTIPLSRNVNGDIGYLNQYRFARNGGRATTEHALNVQLTVNLTQHRHAETGD